MAAAPSSVSLPPAPANTLLPLPPRIVLASRFPTRLSSPDRPTNRVSNTSAIRSSLTQAPRSASSCCRWQEAPHRQRCWKYRQTARRPQWSDRFVCLTATRLTHRRREPSQFRKPLSVNCVGKHRLDRQASAAKEMIGHNAIKVAAHCLGAKPADDVANTRVLADHSQVVLRVGIG